MDGATCPLSVGYAVAYKVSSPRLCSWSGSGQVLEDEGCCKMRGPSSQPEGRGRRSSISSCMCLWSQPGDQGRGLGWKPQSEQKRGENCAWALEPDGPVFKS